MIECGAQYLFDIIEIPELPDFVNNYLDKIYGSYVNLHNIFIDNYHNIILSLVTSIKTIISSLFSYIKVISTIIITSFDDCLKLLELFEPDYMFLDRSNTSVKGLTHKLFDIADMVIHIKNLPPVPIPSYNDILVIRAAKPEVDTSSLREIFNHLNNTYSFGTLDMEYLLIMPNELNALALIDNAIRAFLTNPLNGIIHRPEILSAVFYGDNGNMVINSRRRTLMPIVDLQYAMYYQSLIESDTLRQILPYFFELDDQVPVLLEIPDSVAFRNLGLFNRYLNNLIIHSTYYGDLTINNISFAVNGLQFKLPDRYISSLISRNVSLDVSRYHGYGFIFFSEIMKSLIQVLFRSRDSGESIMNYIRIIDGSGAIMHGWIDLTPAIRPIDPVNIHQPRLQEYVALIMRNNCDFDPMSKQFNYDNNLPKLDFRQVRVRPQPVDRSN